MFLDYKPQVLHLMLVLAGWMLTSVAGSSDDQANKSNSISGSATQGVTLIARDDAGNLQSLLIDKVEQDPLDTELSLYTVLLKNSHKQRWQNLCEPDANGVAKSIPLSGHWDTNGNHIPSNEVTFACSSGVLAKCVRWGYKPWKTVNGQSLRAYHQTCTRMARADYCGNGVGHTQDGTPINMFDKLGIQGRDKVDNMKFEAAWSPQGAVMLNRTRWPNTLEKLRKECPKKLKEFFNGGALDHIDIKNTSPDALIFNDSIVR